ncbi:hypothetical protein LAZ67_3004459, partial [Cordylochernes scorpioides]
MATNMVWAESPSKAEDKPVRLGSKAQPSAEITAKDVLQNKNPIVLTKNQNYVNPSAGSQDANSAAPVDLAANPTSDAAAQVRRNWADITEEVNPGAEEGFTLVQGRKRRRGSANSPTAAAPSSNPGGSRTIRRPQPSAGSVPRAQEIRVTRAHIAEARARQASSSEEHCVYIEHSPELEPFHYLRALDRMLGGTAGVIQITKVNGHQLLGLTNRSLAERLISEGLEVEGTLLRAFPFRKRAERITVGNLPFFVADSAVITALSPYGRVTSIAPKQMKAGPYVYVDGRRDVFITLHEGITIERLPTRLDINIKGEAWPAYLSSGIRCSRCHGQGHRRAICPLLAGLANNTRMAPPTTPAGVPPPTTPAPPQRSTAQPPAPTPSNPAMEVCSAPPVARAALHSSAPRPSPPAAPAYPMEETPPAPPPVTPASSLRTPGSREPAAPTPDVEMSIVEETFASSTSSAKNATRVDLDAFIEKHPSVSFAGTDALGLGREEVLDLLSSRTKTQRKGPLLSPPQCDALAGLIRQILNLKPGAASNLYKVLGQVKAELRTTPAAVPPTPPLPAPRPAEPMLPTTHREELTPPLMTPPPPAPTDMEEDDPITEEERCAPPPPAPRLAGPIPPVPHGDTTTPAMTTPPPPLSLDRRWKMTGDLIHELSREIDLEHTFQTQVDMDDIVRAVLYPGDREPFIKRLPTRDRYILSGFIHTAIWRARDGDPSMLEIHHMSTHDETDALGLGREEVLDLLSSRTKAQRKGPLLSPPQCDALAGLIRQILDLRPGAASNLYKVLGQVKAELRTTPTAVSPTPPLPAPRPAEPTPPAPHGKMTTPALATSPLFQVEEDLTSKRWDEAADIIYKLCNERYSGPLTDLGITEGDITDAVIYPEDREPLLRTCSTQKKNLITEIISAAIERARDSDPFVRDGLAEAELDEETPYEDVIRTSYTLIEMRIADLRNEDRLIWKLMLEDKEIDYRELEEEKNTVIHYYQKWKDLEIEINHFLSSLMKDTEALHGTSSKKGSLPGTRVCRLPNLDLKICDGSSLEVGISEKPRVVGVTLMKAVDPASIKEDAGIVVSSEQMVEETSKQIAVEESKKAQLVKGHFAEDGEKAQVKKKSVVEIDESHRAEVEKESVDADEEKVLDVEQGMDSKNTEEVKLLYAEQGTDSKIAEKLDAEQGTDSKVAEKLDAEQGTDSKVAERQDAELENGKDSEAETKDNEVGDSETAVKGYESVSNSKAVADGDDQVEISDGKAESIDDIEERVVRVPASRKLVEAGQTGDVEFKVKGCYFPDRPVFECGSKATPIRPVFDDASCRGNCGLALRRSPKEQVPTPAKGLNLGDKSPEKSGKGARLERIANLVDYRTIILSGLRSLKKISESYDCSRPADDTSEPSDDTSKPADDALASDPDSSGGKAQGSQEVPEIAVEDSDEKSAFEDSQPSEPLDVDGSGVGASSDVESNVIRTLGLGWIQSEDCFLCEVQSLEKTSATTTSEMLSFIAKLEDPLRWLAPVLVTGKVMVQGHDNHGGRKVSRMATNFIRAESPSKAEQKPVRHSEKAQPCAELSKKEDFQKKTSNLFNKNQNYANPPAGGHHANPATPTDFVTASFSEAAAQANRSWADLAEDNNHESEEPFITVQRKKRRRGSAESPAAAAPSSNIRGAGAIRRPRSSTGWAPRAEEIRTTRAHIAEARARQASSTEDHCVYVERSPELEPFHYMRAIERMFGGTREVFQLTKMNGHFLVGLANRGMAERLVNEGLEVEGTLHRAFPFRKRAERITVGNLPFFVGDAAVISALSSFGRVTSIAPKLMKAGPYIYNDGRREAFIIFREGMTIERLPTRLDITIKGEAWPAYLSSGIRCSRCRGQGHRRANCPLLAGLANNTRLAPPTTPAAVPSTTTSAPPQRSAAQPPTPASSSPARETPGTSPAARAVTTSTAPRPSPPVAPAVPMEEAPSAPPPVTPAPSLQAPGVPAQRTLGSAAPTPDVEMSIVEETFASSSTSSAKNATRVDLDAFIEGHPSVSFAETDALGLGREEVLDLLSSRTKAQRKGPLLSPPLCDALVGVIRQILNLRPGAASNLYKVLGQVKAELRTTPAEPPTPPLPAPRPSGPTLPTPHSEELMPAVLTPPPPALEDNPDLAQWE